jgi:hypothetical protein
MPIPADAQAHFDRAVRNLNQAGLNQPTVEVITGAAAMAHIDVAEGVSKVMIAAADQMTAAADSFATTMNNTVQRAYEAEQALDEGPRLGVSSADCFHTCSGRGCDSRVLEEVSENRG